MNRHNLLLHRSITCPLAKTTYPSLASWLNINFQQLINLNILQIQQYKAKLGIKIINFFVIFSCLSCNNFISNSCIKEYNGEE